MTPTGEVRIVGRRATDLIKTGGYKVGAGEVEAALLEHAAVREAAVIGVPDEDLGERIVAFVVAAPGATPRARGARRARRPPARAAQAAADRPARRGAAPERDGEGAEEGAREAPLNGTIVIREQASVASPPGRHRDRGEAARGGARDPASSGSEAGTRRLLAEGEPRREALPPGPSSFAAGAGGAAPRSNIGSVRAPHVDDRELLRAAGPLHHDDVAALATEKRRRDGGVTLTEAAPRIRLVGADDAPGRGDSGLVLDGHPRGERHRTLGRPIWAEHRQCGERRLGERHAPVELGQARGATGLRSGCPRILLAQPARSARSAA